ncbi:MAG: integrase, partial [Alphaproteobacteria bacterium CG_4_10_14_0_8_um_filter_53_9]
MPLTNTAIQAAKPKDKPYKLTDGEGLYLLVTPAGGKLWNLKYRYFGTEKKLSLGAFPAVSLADARERKLEARKLLAADIDPGETKKEKKAAQQERMANTFESVAREWHAHNLNGWTPKTAGYLLRRLERDVFPMIGSRPIDSVTPKDILAVLKGIEARGVGEIARRCKDTCNQIFRYAILHEKCTTNPAAGFKSKDALQPYTKT